MILWNYSQLNPTNEYCRLCYWPNNSMCRYPSVQVGFNWLLSHALWINVFIGMHAHVF